MPVTLSFITGIRLDTSVPKAARIVGPGDDVVIGHAPSGIVNALRLLQKDGLAYEALVRLALRGGGLEGLRTLHECLGQLLARCWIVHQVCHQGVPIVGAIPLTNDYRWTLQPPPDDQEFVLSRFVFMRRDGTQFVLESPIARAQVVLYDWRAIVLLWRISGFSGTPQAGIPNTGLPARAVRSMTELLWNAGFLTTIGDRHDVPEDETPPLLHWEFHDLLFHTRSRLGRHRSPFGATYRLEGLVAPAPAVKPRPPGKRIPLVRPNIARLMKADWSLTRALEERRSQRQHGPERITRRQLGEFLYRTARVRYVTNGGRYPVTNRVYPSGGAAYALELYLAVNECEDLDAGLYHYCPDRHELQRVARMNSDVQEILADAARAVGADSPQVLVIMAARFLRTSWKYSAVSYALILKDVGVLLQTMYLVATTMDLGACAVGAGDSDLFAKAAGTGYFDESSVGEIILGRVP